MNEGGDTDAIRHERDLFRLAQRAGSIGLWYSDPGDTGKLIWTDETYRIFGLTKDTFDGKVSTFFKAIHPDDLAAVRAASEDALDPLKRAPYQIEHRIIRPNGDVRWVHQEGQVIWGIDGKPVQFIGTIQDVTDRQEIQARLRASEERFRTLFEAAGDAIFLMDKDVFVACNQKTLDIFACPRERIIGNHPYTLSPELQPDGRPSKEAAMEKITAALGGALQRFPWRHVRCNGTEFDAEVTLTRVELDGRPYLQAIVRDRTEEIALQRQQQRLVSIIENTPEYIGTATPDGKAVYLNDAFRRILAPEWKEKAAEPGVVSISVFHTPEAGKIVMETGIPAAVKHGIWQGESALLDARGRAFPVLQTIVAHLDAAGNLEFLSIICRDIEGMKVTQQKMEESEQRFRTLVENSSDVIIVVAADGKRLYVSPNIARFTGRTVEETALVNPLTEHVHPDNRAAVDAAFQRVVRGPEGNIEQLEARLRHKDGHWLWMEVVAQNHLQDAAVRGIVLNIRDITERKEAEDNQVLSEAKFHSFADQAPMAIQLFRPDGLCTYANPAWQKFWESDPAEAVMHYNVREDKQAKERGISELVERAFKGEAVEIPPFYYDPELNGKKGRPRWVRTHFYAIRTSTGDIGEVALIGEDVSSEHESQAAVQDALARLDGIVNAMGDPVFVKDRKHRWVLLNDALCKLVGHSREELLGKSDYDFFPAKEADVFWAKDEEVFNTEKENINEERIAQPDGTEISILTRKSIYTDPSGEKFIVGVIRDVTMLQRAQAAEGRASELERLNRLLIGREIKMVELKNELDILKKKMAEK